MHRNPNECGSLFVVSFERNGVLRWAFPKEMEWSLSRKTCALPSKAMHRNQNRCARENQSEDLIGSCEGIGSYLHRKPEPVRVSFGGLFWWSLLVVSFERNGFLMWTFPNEMEWSLCIGSCEGIG